MTRQTISTHRVADTTVLFVSEGDAGRVGLQMFPSALAGMLATRRTGLRGRPEVDALPKMWNPPACMLDPLIHVKIVGDDYTGSFGQGRTMRSASSNGKFKYEAQTVSRQGERTTIVTTLRSEAGYWMEHRLSWYDGEAAVEVESRFINRSQKPVTLEMLTSFSLGGITPFDPADAPNRLRVHRFRSGWSAEGRLETQTIEQLHLERSWIGAGLFSERFGQVGSMPVRGWFPFVAVEDTKAGVTWGAQLAWAGSWQMEIARQHDEVSISGGLADREMGHWTRTLQPGEELATPAATIACVAGGLDELCDRLTAVQHRAADRHPAIEHDLPIVMNEWCTTWGDPRHDAMVDIARHLKGSEVRYLVIDAGWYKGEQGNWDNSHGDWVPSKKLFPEGLAATAAAIRKEGLIPGLWFEMETVGANSAAFSLVDHLLKRDGVPITARSRRFWDLNDPYAVDFLTKKVIDLLETCGFGYLKVDYNETIGIGCDGAESLGEGLRRHVLGVHRFFERIRERLPELVIENCSSGGHRLEPSMLARTAMSSFSDAHELVEIPIIAANLHRLLLPRQSQVWAVLRQTDSDRRVNYSLAATFLGRMCLSGEIDRLSDSQWRLVVNAQRVYRRAVPIIKRGISRRFEQKSESWRYPEGWQAMVRTAEDGKSALVVAHTFAKGPQQIRIPLPAGGGWSVVEQLHEAAYGAAVEGQNLVWKSGGDFGAAVVLLAR